MLQAPLTFAETKDSPREPPGGGYLFLVTRRGPGLGIVLRITRIAASEEAPETKEDSAFCMNLLAYNEPK